MADQSATIEGRNPTIEGNGDNRIKMNFDMLMLLDRGEQTAWALFIEQFSPIAKRVLDDLADDPGPPSITIPVEVTQK